MDGTHALGRLVRSRGHADESILPAHGRLAGSRRYLAGDPGPQAGAALGGRADGGLGPEEPEDSGDGALGRILLAPGGAERRPLLDPDPLSDAAKIHAPGAGRGRRPTRGAPRAGTMGPSCRR